MNQDILKQAGSLIAAGFETKHFNEHAEFLVKNLKISNWILFARNVESHEQLNDLTTVISRRTAENNPQGAWLTIDQEGGIVSRLHGDLNCYPGAMACAATGDSRNTQRAAAITAQHLRALGFHQNLAPVADLATNRRSPIVGPRSFHGDPEITADHVAAACRGYQENGILATVKHFPGHGDVAEDSHLELPTLRQPLSILEERELVPFKTAIAQGAGSIMMAHLRVPSMSSLNLPASLNKDIIQGYLRNKMGFEGLVVSDCMEMHAISKNYSMAEAALLAIEAGTDFCFVSHSPELQEEAVKGLYDAIKSGRLPHSRVNESIQRQQRARSWYAQEPKESITIGGIEIPHPEMEEISRKSITMVKNQGFIPSGGLKDDPCLQILYVVRPEQFIGENTVSGGDPMEAFKEAFPRSRFRQEYANELEKRLKEEPLELKAVKKLLIITCDTGFYSAAVEALQELIHQEIPCGVAVMRTPYEADLFMEADMVLLGYENTPPAIKAVITKMMDNPQSSMVV